MIRRSVTAAGGLRTGGALALLALMAPPTSTTARAQGAPVPAVRLTFAEAIARAQEQNPTVAQAAAGILRADALIRAARAATLPQVYGSVASTTLNRGVDFDDATVTPRSQLTGSLTAEAPIIAVAAWARRAQAQDARNVAELTVADTKRNVAFAAADAYFSILVQRRLVESSERARDTAKAHFDLATELEQGGSGSRLNALRAQQQYSVDAGLVESARLALYRAQEALGVLTAAGGPVDAADEPDLAAPPRADGPTSLFRTDLRLFAAEQQQAERAARDTSKEWYPTLNAIFQPSTTYPSQFFLPQNSWRFLLQANVPVFDSGQRGALKMERQAAADRFRAALAGATTEAHAQVRAAREAVASGERSLATARAAAEQAQQVVEITNVSFRAGASTNIEVIDAERVARDAATAVALAEDRLRRARLELLHALGRFP